MLCAISGESPQQPVASRKSGNVFERRLIEQYIKENGTDPVNGEELTIDDLLDLKQPRVVRPRPPTATSIPGLLATFQNEWDALILETYQLKQQLSETRQELSTALYYNDAAEKVIARLQRERDEVRDTLARLQVSAPTNGVNGDAMQVDGQGLPDAVVARVEQTQAQLSATRRKRPIPQGWATAEDIQTFGENKVVDAVAPAGTFLAVDQTAENALLGHSTGFSVFSILQNKVSYAVADVGGQVRTGTWWGNKAVVGLSTGAIKIYEQNAELAILSKHAGPVVDTALHPCGDILASIGSDRSFVLYDLQSSAPLTQRYLEHELTISAFHPDGHLYAVGTSSGAIQLFDVKTLENIHTFTSEESRAVKSLSFSENGTWLASVLEGSSSVTVWNLRTTSMLKAIDIGSPLSTVAWDYTGQYLAVGGASCVAVQHYAKSSKSWSEVFRKAANVVDLGWGGDAQSIVTLKQDGAVAVFSA